MSTSKRASPSSLAKTTLAAIATQAGIETNPDRLHQIDESRAAKIIRVLANRRDGSLAELTQTAAHRLELSQKPIV